MTAFPGAFLQGMLAMSCLVAALFFLRFRKSTGDRLFVIFALAFTLMGVTRIISAALGAGHVHSGYVYTIRFVAYLLIIAAVIDKNRPHSN